MTKVVVTSQNKYLMLDIVRYTQGRCVEAQQDIIEKLNEIVLTAVKALPIPGDQVSYLPTGDGICIVLIEVSGPYDLEVSLGLEILKALESHNKGTEDEMRQFRVRIGINANTDNKIIDINEAENFAGAGINQVQRIMSEADGNQILVGPATFDVLSQREEYMKCLKRFITKDKHGISLTVYQLTLENRPGLDISVPRQFVIKPRAPVRLSKHNAYYFAHAIRHRDYFLGFDDLGGDHYSIEVLLWFLATDSVGAAESRDTDPYKPQVAPSTTATIVEQLEHYASRGFWINWTIAARVAQPDLRLHREYFEGRGISLVYVCNEGRMKLKKDWPDIWAEFGFDQE